MGHFFNLFALFWWNRRSLWIRFWTIRCFTIYRRRLICIFAFRRCRNPTNIWHIFINFFFEALDLVLLSVESKVKACVIALHKVYNFKGITLSFWCFFLIFKIIFHFFKFNCNLVWYWNQWQYCFTKWKSSLNRRVEALTPYGVEKSFDWLHVLCL